MSRVLVGSVYFLRLDPARWAERQPFPPLGTLYAASTLRADGHEVHLFDAMLADGTEDWSELVRQVRPDVAVLFDDNFNYLSKMCLGAMRDAALAMVASARESGARVTICSADGSDNPALYLKAGADAVIVGEGEATLRELVDGWSRGEADVAPIKGVAWLDNHEETVRSGRRALHRDLDTVPPPAWDLVDVGQYRDVWMKHHGHFALNMVTSRGCPYRCNWCAKPIWGQAYTIRQPASVAAELAQLTATAKPDYIWFMDDIMGLKPSWWRDFAEALDRLQLKVPFKCLSRADLLLRDGAIPALQQAGCDIVWMGAESGSQEILDAMDKDLTVLAITESAQRLKAAGIRVGMFLQFGYPGEGMREILQTLAMLWTAAPDEIGVSVSYPLPGTLFYDRVQQQLRDKRNWTVSSDMAMLYQGPFSTRFYRLLHSYVHLEFRLRRAIDRMSGLFSGRAKMGRAEFRACAAFLYCGTMIPLYRLGLLLLRLAPREELPLKAEATA